MNLKNAYAKIPAMPSALLWVLAGAVFTAMLLGFCEETNNYTLLPKVGRTFPAALPAFSLDFVLLPQECRLVHAEVVRCYLSDHRPVLVEFDLDLPGYRV